MKKRTSRKIHPQSSLIGRKERCLPWQKKKREKKVNQGERRHILVNVAPSKELDLLLLEDRNSLHTFF